MTLIAVVLPEPLGPTRPRISPGATWKLKPSSARKPPKRFTSFATLRIGSVISGDMPSPPRRQRHQPRRQEQHQAHDQKTIDQLEILRRGEPDHIVDAIEDDHADNGAGDGGNPAEQREHDGENREIAGEDV